MSWFHVPCQALPEQVAPRSFVSCCVIYSLVSFCAKFGTSVLGTKILVTRSWYQKKLLHKFQYQDVVTEILVPRFWYQVSGIKSLVPRCWYQILAPVFVPFSKFAVSHCVNEFCVKKFCAMPCQNSPCPHVRAAPQPP